MGHQQMTTECKTKDGTTFTFRKEATKRDKSDMNVFIGEYTKIGTDGKVRVNSNALFPWLFERFVVGWSGGPQTSGKAVLEALYEQPADAEEDQIMVVGAHIFNEVSGLTPMDESKKKD